MKNKNLNNLAILSKKIKALLDSKMYTYGARFRKTSIVDSIIFRLMYSQKEVSQDLVASRLNTLKSTKTKTIKICRSAYTDREKSIGIELYAELYNILDEHIATNYQKKYTTNIFAVDGTQNHLSKDMVKDGFKLNPNGESINSMALGIYSITHNFPVALNLIKNKNEREAFMDFINNTDKYKGSIFIMDRGYISSELFDFLERKEIKYICRQKSNSLLIPDENDKIVDDNGKQRRIVTYTIGKNEYYLISNLFDTKEYTTEIMKQLYHKRWRIEEFFKYLKTNTNFSVMKEHSQDALMKNIYGQLIVCRIVELLKYIHGPNLNKMKNDPATCIINNKILTDGVYTEFIYTFFCGKANVTYSRQFIKLKTIFQTTKLGQHNKRTSCIPFSKWFIKRYYKGYKCVNTEDNSYISKKAHRKEVKQKKINLITIQKAQKKALKEQKKIEKKITIDMLKVQKIGAKEQKNKNKETAKKIIKSQVG